MGKSISTLLVEKTMDKKSRVIRNGADLHRAVTAIKALPVDKPLQITVQYYVPPKTDSQRGFFHYLLDVWSKEIGIPSGHLKEVCKAELYGWTTRRIGRIEIMVADSPSSEDYAKTQYSDLIETAYRLAAESGVVLPLPERVAA